MSYYIYNNKYKKYQSAAYLGSLLCLCSFHFLFKSKMDCVDLLFGPHVHNHLGMWSKTHERTWIIMITNYWFLVKGTSQTVPYL